MVCLGVSPDPKLDLDWATVYRRAGTDCGNCFRGCLLTELAGCSRLLAAALSSSSCGLLHVAAPCPRSPATCFPSGEGARRPRWALRCCLGLSFGAHTPSLLLYPTQFSPDLV